MPSKRRLTDYQPTPEEDQAHLDRLAVINRPFPPIRHVIYTGKIWAGALITHDDDAMFLKGQREYLGEMYFIED